MQILIATYSITLSVTLILQANYLWQLQVA
jgi:hypothetical protein